MKTSTASPVMSATNKKSVPPRSWRQAKDHPAIYAVNDLRDEFPGDEDLMIQIVLSDGWLLDGDLDSFYVKNLSDLRDLWIGIVKCQQGPSLLSDMLECRQ